jgi:hypothetical protein
MSEAHPAEGESALDPQGVDEHQPPRADLFDAIFWIVLGLAVLVGSITMDRLEAQHINPYTVPGLLPGLLGIAMILLGLVLAERSRERGAFTRHVELVGADERESRKRVWVVLALCVGYGVVLIGHGIPFWLASSIYVTGSILVLQRMSRETLDRQFTPRLLAKALVIGVLSSVITQLVFQEVFLVRMP